jgi:hypothetical protein
MLGLEANVDNPRDRLRNCRIRNRLAVNMLLALADE